MSTCRDARHAVTTARWRDGALRELRQLKPNSPTVFQWRLVAKALVGMFDVPKNRSPVVEQ